MRKNLWGKLPEATETISPLYILREQAALLETETEGVLRGRVVAADNSGRLLRYEFEIVVPSLENYVYAVADLKFPPEKLYPAILQDFCQRKSFETRDEADFEETLAGVLTSSELRKAISSLMATARSK